MPSKKVPQKAAWNDTRGQTKAEKRGQKRPSSEVTSAVSIDREKFRWSAKYLDHGYEGDWHWKINPKGIKDILDVLEQLSVLHWFEVKDMETHTNRKTRPLNHSQPVATLCKDARDRLDDLGRGDQESLFRIRHGNTVRVWGIMEGPIFNLLWYDPEHKVYPTEAK